MTRPALLALRMLRYRVAAMIWMFMLLGAARRDGLASFSWSYAWASLALAASYVAATSVNDVADRDIDRINHPRDRGRPLVTGEARERELLVLHVLAAALALAAAVPLGYRGLALVAASLAIGQAYSLPPARVSYRTYLAPLLLGVAYVVIPYALGSLAAGGLPGRGDALLCAALYALFVARINLKDFRDRAGDAAFGKPTLLLRFGKDATCAVSLAALVTGTALLLAALAPPAPVAAVLLLLALAIGWQLRTLRRAPQGRAEQVAIGIGARMGNGLLLSSLGWLVLEGSGASAGERTVFVCALALAFCSGFLALATRPDEVVIGYKG